MAKHPELPDWFPLAIYTQALTNNEWLEEIALRAGLETADRNRREGKVGGLTVDDPSADVFRALFVTRESRNRKAQLAEARGRNIWPIREPSPFEMLFMAEMDRISPKHQEAEQWAKRLRTEGAKALREFATSGARIRMSEMERAVDAEDPSHEFYMDILGRRAPVLIDMDQDDQTLEIAFKVWLAGARDVTGEKSQRPIGKKEFEKWQRFGLLPAFDLRFWSHVNGVRYTDARIANAIWPDHDATDDFVDITERFRKVTKPMVEETFAWNYVMRFWQQVQLRNDLDAMFERNKDKWDALKRDKNKRKKKAVA